MGITASSFLNDVYLVYFYTRFLSGICCNLSTLINLNICIKEERHNDYLQCSSCIFWLFIFRFCNSHASTCILQGNAIFQVVQFSHFSHMLLLHFVIHLDRSAINRFSSSKRRVAFIFSFLPPFILFEILRLFLDYYYLFILEIMFSLYSRSYLVWPHSNLWIYWWRIKPLV